MSHAGLWTLMLNTFGEYEGLYRLYTAAEHKAL